MTTHRAPAKIIPRAFPGIKPNEIEELIMYSKVRAYLPGSVLCRENATEDRFYMLYWSWESIRHQIVNKLLPEKPAEEAPVTKIVKPPKEHKGITIKGIDNVLYHTAKCCFPIPGDGLIGFVTRGRGVTIHRKNCPNADRLALDDARLVDVEWKAAGEATSPVKLLIEAVDKPGILASLSAVISSVNVNISNATVNSTEDKKSHITFILEVKDKSQLSGLTQKIAPGRKGNQ